MVEGGAPGGASAARGDRAARALRPWLLAVAGVGAATATAHLVEPFFSHADVAMLLLLNVLVVSAFLPRGPSTANALLSVAAFNFFFVDPRYTFHVDDARFLVTFAVMLGVGLTVSGLTAKVRERALEARAREARTAALYEAARELAALEDAPSILAAAERRISLSTGRRVELHPGDSGAALADLGEADRRAARAALAGGGPAGRGTEVAPDALSLWLPLLAGGRTHGVLRSRPAPGGGGGAEEDAGDPGARRLLDALADQAAQALERPALAEEGAAARLAAEAERTRNELLSTVSHDLRTPLSSITGTAEALLDRGDGLPAGERRDLLASIRDEGNRLGRLVGNLLDLTRVEASGFRPRTERCPVEELLSSALGRLEAALGDRGVTVARTEEIVEVDVDPVLVEQALFNVIENALRHTPAGSPLEIRTLLAGSRVAVEVADRGPGLPPGREERIFERFQRGDSGGSGGAGLGLAVARAVFRVHGGLLEARNREGGGAVFRAELPAPGEGR